MTLFNALPFTRFALGLLAAGFLACALPSPLEAARIPPSTLHEVLQSGGEPVNRYTLPAGSAFQVLLETPVSTAINQVGDPIEAVMTHRLFLSEQIILTRNTHLYGYVSRLEPPLEGKNAILSVHFNKMTLENGETLAIDAHVNTGNPEHIWGGGSTPGTRPVRSTQRVYEIGEYNRIVYAGPRAMGAQIQFKPGEFWPVVLERPLVLVIPGD